MAVTLTQQKKKALAKYIQKAVNSHFNADDSNRLTLGKAGEFIAHGLDFADHKELVDALKSHQPENDRGAIQIDREIDEIAHYVAGMVALVLKEYLEDSDLEPEEEQRVIEAVFFELQHALYVTFEFLPKPAFETGPMQMPTGMEWYKATMSRFYFDLIDLYWAALEQNGYPIDDNPDERGVTAAFRYYDNPELLEATEETLRMDMEEHNFCDRVPECLQTFTDFASLTLQVALSGTDGVPDHIVARINELFEAPPEGWVNQLTDMNFLLIRHRLPQRLLGLFLGMFSLDIDRITALTMAARRRSQQQLEEFFVCPDCEAAEDHKHLH